MRKLSPFHRRQVSAGALLCMASLVCHAAPAGAELVYGNFAPGTTWASNSSLYGITIYHYWNKWAPNGDGIVWGGYAAEFSPAANATFTTAEVPLSGQGTVRVSLRAASAPGGPGAILEQFDVLLTGDGRSRVYTVTSQLSPRLREGTPYWLEVVPVSDPSSAYWMSSTQAGRVVHVDRPGVWSRIWDAWIPAFRIHGETVVPVTLDIKPGSFPNAVNPRSEGVIPVAILSSADFDAATVKVDTVRFGRTGSEAPAAHSALEYVDGDAFIDMVLHFRTQQTGIACGSTRASLNGTTVSDERIRGEDSIQTVGCK